MAIEITPLQPGGEDAEPDPRPDGTPGAGKTPSAKALQPVDPFERIRKACVAEGRHRMMDGDDVDDIAQLIMLDVREKYGDAVTKFPWRWLPQFVSTQFRDIIDEGARAEARHPKVALVDDEDGDETLADPSPGSRDPEARFMGKELTERVEREINRWSARRRTAFLMGLAGKPRKEIAAKIGRTVAAVDTQLAAAREALFVLLEPDYPDVRQRGNAKPKPRIETTTKTNGRTTQ